MLIGKGDFANSWLDFLIKAKTSTSKGGIFSLSIFEVFRHSLLNVLMLSTLTLTSYNY